MQGRASRALIRWLLIAAGVGVAITNGRPFSPMFDPVLFWLGRLAGGGAAAGSATVFHGSSVAITLATMLLATLPVLSIRFLRPRTGGTTLAAIWLALNLLLAAPTLLTLSEIGD